MLAIKGDIIEMAKRGRFDVIMQGCNCFCAMGRGLALSIKREFPEAYEADKLTKKGDPTKIGTCSCATCSVGRNVFDIVNCYTQYHWNGISVLADYDGVRSCMRWIKKQYSGKRIGLPRIGAGLARGDWTVIKNIIEEELSGENVTLVEYDKADTL